MKTGRVLYCVAMGLLIAFSGCVPLSMPDLACDQAMTPNPITKVPEATPGCSFNLEQGKMVDVVQPLRDGYEVHYLVSSYEHADGKVAVFIARIGYDPQGHPHSGVRGSGRIEISHLQTEATFDHLKLRVQRHPAPDGSITLVAAFWSP